MLQVQLLRNYERTKGLVIRMNAEMIMALVIISFVAGIMIIIGLTQIAKREEPVGFYNVIAPPKKEEISDINGNYINTIRIILLIGGCAFE